MQTAPIFSKLKQQCIHKAVYLWAFAFCAALWRLGYPRPMVDDLFYCGAGLNLAAGGDFSNPFLARLQFQSHYFFAYPPTHSYAVFAWLKLWGTSAASMTGLVIGMYFLASAATVAILRKHGSRVWLQYLAPLLVATSLLDVGLRPEPLSIGLGMLGFALIECSSAGVPVVVAGFLMMFFGGSAAPRMVPFITMLVLLAIYRLWLVSSSKRQPFSLVMLAALLALVSVTLVLLLMIDFRFHEFWVTFHATATKLVGGSKLALFLGYLRQIKYLWLWPLSLATVVAALFGNRRGRSLWQPSWPQLPTWENPLEGSGTFSGQFAADFHWPSPSAHLGMRPFGGYFWC